MLVIDHLAKAFGQVHALRGASFEMQSGEVVALFGRNGAGKTTLMSCVAGLLRPDHGGVVIDGAVVTTARSAAQEGVGYAPQPIGLFRRATVAQNLAFYGRAFGLSAAEARGAAHELAERLGFESRWHDRVATLSGGMERRVHIASAMVHKPRWLLIDEGTAGVDVETRHVILKLVSEAASSGCSVLYSSHYPAEIEALDCRIVVLDAGRVIYDGTTDSLRRNARSIVRASVSKDIGDTLSVTGAVVNGRDIVIETDEPEHGLNALIEQLGAARAELRTLTVEQASLETALNQVLQHGEPAST